MQPLYCFLAEKVCDESLATESLSLHPSQALPTPCGGASRLADMHYSVCVHQNLLFPTQLALLTLTTLAMTKGSSSHDFISWSCDRSDVWNDETHGGLLVAAAYIAAAGHDAGHPA